MRPNRLKNYLRQIEESVSSRMFQSLYVQLDDGFEVDVAGGGELSCAIHTSSVLSLSGMIDGPHSTVSTTLKQMAKHGWVKSDKPLPGAVVHWPASDDGHEHVGFWMGEDRLISNSRLQRVPIVHGAKLYDGRLPQSYFIRPVLLTNNQEPLK